MHWFGSGSVARLVLRITKGLLASDLSLGTSEKFAEANGLLADSSRVYDIDEVVVVSQPKENFRLRQQPLSTLPLVLIRSNGAISFSRFARTFLLCS